MVPGFVVSQVSEARALLRVVAVGDEAVGGVAAAGELFGEGAVGVGGAEVLLDGAVAAAADAGDDGEAGRRVAG